MKKLRTFAVFISLAGAASILLISLSSVSSVQSATDGYAQSQKQFYMSKEILPDHIAYPVLMAVDRIRLESATPTEQVYLKTAYANQRLKFAQELLEKGDTDLAVTTISKAEKYLLSAGNQAIELEMLPTVLKHLVATLEYHKEQTSLLGQELTDNQRAIIDGLNEECQVMLDQLSSRL